MLNTKLVYVLTCSQEGSYIEQALMSIWSARYHNPDAHIVLLTDDRTDGLLVGARGGLTDYISEKIVVPFEDADASMKYRSRWIKTSVRKLVDGDFLFIDCDTVICRSLEGVDAFDCDLGAVWESHLKVDDYCVRLRNEAVKSNQIIGVDLIAEGEYFSSGVLFVKDNPVTHRFYDLWHKYWEEGAGMGLSIDQPSMAKANRDMGHIIRRIPDTYNCIVFTRNTFIGQAHILHIASYQNPSFLFTDKVLGLIRRDGLTDWIRDFLLRPCDSILPFDYTVRHSSVRERMVWIRHISRTVRIIGNEFPELQSDFPMQSSLRGWVMFLFKLHLYGSGAACWMIWKRLQVLRKGALKDNVCRK